MIRVLIAATLLALPSMALADDATLLGPQSSQSSGAVTSPSTAADQSGSGVSTQSGSILQPAGTSTSSLQSADASGGGVTQAPANQLQQTGGGDAIKLFVQGEADSPKELDTSSGFSWLGYMLVVILVIAALTLAAWLLSRPRPVASAE